MFTWLTSTYGLVRHYYALPSAKDAEGHEIAAARGVLASIMGMLRNGATLAVATDHVVESFRNDLWPGYKTSAGVPSDLLAQFPLLEKFCPQAPRSPQAQTKAFFGATVCYANAAERSES